MKSIEATCLFFRHGHTRYEQGNKPCTIEEANDLAMPPQETPETSEAYAERVREAEQIVARNADSSATYLSLEKPVAIISSPTGRGLHTAKVIHEVLKKKGFRFLLPAITPKTLLTEIQNFQWNFFLPLLEGGKVTFEGQTFEVNKGQTNPGNLSAGEYFFRDVLHNLPKKVKKSWPKGYVELIQSFEPAFPARIRSIGVIKGVFQSPETQHILVSHDALCGFMVRAWSQGKETELSRGNFLTLRGTSDDARTETLGTNTSGDRSTNIFDPKVYGQQA